MSKYVPTTDEVRKMYALGRGFYGTVPSMRLSAEFERWLARVKADALERAARDLRAAECGPYESESGMCGDDWGNDAKKIDTWYAAEIEEFAAKYRQEAR